jgi:hypothetical protein
MMAASATPPTPTPMPMEAPVERPPDDEEEEVEESGEEVVEELELEELSSAPSSPSWAAEPVGVPGVAVGTEAESSVSIIQKVRCQFSRV